MSGELEKVVSEVAKVDPKVGGEEVQATDQTASPIWMSQGETLWWVRKVADKKGTQRWVDIQGCDRGESRQPHVRELCNSQDGVKRAKSG